VAGAAVAVVAVAEVIGVGLTACGRGVRIRMGISPAHVQYGSMRGLVGLASVVGLSAWEF
jgi:hypothetical protein